jgi:hypothetical protein
MNKKPGTLILFLFLFGQTLAFGQSGANDFLKIIIIRHGENPVKGDNLSCQGLNRSLQLPAVLNSKFGIPNYTYVPALSHDAATKHARMFQTIIPMSVKYDLKINSKFDEKDSTNLAAEIRSKNGTILLVWDHKAIPSIVRALGVPNFFLKWRDDDYDSIWIIDLVHGIPVFSTDKEGLSPGPVCPGSP